MSQFIPYTLRELYINDKKQVVEVATHVDLGRLIAWRKWVLRGEPVVLVMIDGYSTGSLTWIHVRADDQDLDGLIADIVKTRSGESDGSDDAIPGPIPV